MKKKGMSVQIVITATDAEGHAVEVMNCTQQDNGEAMKVHMNVVDEFQTIAVMAMAAAASSVLRKGEPCDCPVCTERRALAVAAGVPEKVAKRAVLH